MPVSNLLRAGVALALCVIASEWSLRAAVTVAGPPGLTVAVADAGTYEVSIASPAWRFAGAIGFPLANISADSGSDALGAYNQISFDFRSDALRHAFIRAYVGQRAILFSANNPAAAPNTFSFPAFGAFPQDLQHIGFAGMFAFPSFHGLPEESPWVFFDGTANSFIISPAANFMLARTAWGPGGELSGGISPKISSLPAGFTHQVLLVVENGINRAFDSWGRDLTTLRGKTRPANDASPTLKSLGYWTDAGAAYYYRTEPSFSYPDTLAAVKTRFDELGTQLGYLQLDSWFYPKGPAADWKDRSGGIHHYDAAPELFGGGLSQFQQKVGVPLATHARWLDPSSPYRQQYTFSGNVSTDPLFWDSIAQRLADSGVATYEQDWLSEQAQPNFNLTDPDAFLDNMAASMARAHLDIQYCMPTTRHVMQSSKYDSVTMVRASEDRFSRGRWTQFLYVSRLLSALGVWPFTDNFLSSETDNLLLATLSAGPVGIGDPIDAIDGANLLKAARRDGVIVKPDVPLVPLDSSFLGGATSPNAPMIASTYTDFGRGLRAHYVFAYARGDGGRAVFRLSDLGASGPVYVYDYFSAGGYATEASDTVEDPMGNGRTYLIVAPIGRSGIAVLGDKDHFISLGKKRIAALEDDGAARVSVVFAPGEAARTIFGYSPRPPRVRALAGANGPLQYDPGTRLFTVSVMPGPEGIATISLVQSRPGGGTRLPAARFGSLEP